MHETRRLYQVRKFFDPLIVTNTGAADAVHVTDWDASAVGENGIGRHKTWFEELSMCPRWP